MVVTASTLSQLSTETWRELAKWWRMSINRHWFNWTATKFSHVDYPDTWFASAIPWSEHNADAFAGTHEKYVLIIYDEGNAIADTIYETTEGALTTPGAIWVVFGNYTKNTGRFAECFAGLTRDRWIRFQIDSRRARKANKAQIRQWIEDYEPGQRPERFSMVLQSWDTANKATELSDYSVCTTWGAFDNRYYLLDVFRQRLNYPDLKRKVQELAKRDRPHAILIEDKASGTQLIQDLKAEGVYAVRAYQPPSGTDKIMRLHAQTAAFENGRVLLPAKAPWLLEYINELTSFPGARNDDQVDSTTQALDHLRTYERGILRIPPEVLAWARTPRFNRIY